MTEQLDLGGIWQHEQIEECKALRVEIKRLRMALAEYSDHGNWILGLRHTILFGEAIVWQGPTNNGYELAERALEGEHDD